MSLEIHHPNPIETHWQQLLLDSEKAQRGRCLSSEQVELLRRAYRAGVEAKADEVQPMITKMELRFRRKMAHHAQPVIAGSN